MRIDRPRAGALSLVLLAGCSDGFHSGAASTDTDGAVHQRVTPFAGHAGEGGAGGSVQSSGGHPGVDAGADEPFDGNAGALGDASFAGRGGTPASTDSSARPPLPCSGATAGPSMALVTSSSGQSYCIDETEVTIRDYAAFLATKPAPTLAPPGVCAFKQSFAPDGDFPPTGSDQRPVTLVDWCDAAAYCAFAGKHLCGKIGGGSTAYADFAKPVDEWYFACTSGGKTTLPYGNVFDPSACVGVDFDGTSGFQPTSDAPHDVGQAARCHSSLAPFDTLRDLAGNVAEWEDSCNSMGGSADYCHVRGDSYRQGNQSTMSCAYAPRMTRSSRAGYIGFRCCL